MSDVCVSEHSAKGLTLEMPPAEELHNAFEAVGVSDNSRVVVYYGKDWSPSTRIFFTFDYAGLATVRLPRRRDGGLGDARQDPSRRSRRSRRKGRSRR